MRGFNLCAMGLAFGRYCSPQFDTQAPQQTLHGFIDHNAVAQDLRQLLSPDALVILPTDLAFQNATKRHTAFGAPHIAVVVQVAAEQDIVATVSYSRRTGVPLHVSNTGHAWSTLNATRNAILLRVSELKKIEVADDKETMLIGPGITVKDANTAAYANGKQLTVGSCNCVGVIGASLGGGHGRLQGYYGLMSDAILEARVLLSSGEIVRASEKENPDLLWGLKGAGANFGVVLDARVRINPLINNGLIYNANKVFSSDKIEAVFNEMNKISPLAKAISIYLGFAWFPPAEKVVLLIDYAFMGPGGETEGRKHFKEIFGDIEGITEWDAVHPWNKLNQDGSAGITAGLCAPEQRKNTFTSSLLRYDLIAVREVFEEFNSLVTENPAFRRSLIAWESYPQQKVKAIHPASSAYPHRDSNHLILVQYWYEDSALDEVASAAGRKTRDILHRASGFHPPRVYMNYAHGDESVEEKYGHEEWRLDKLRILKEKYDPTGMFSSFHPV